MARSLLRDAQFRLFWATQVVSSLGSGIGSIALSLTAVLVLDANAMEMGVLAAAAQLPVLLLALHAGVLVDRLPRRPIMVVTNIGRGLLLALIPLASVAGVLRIELVWLVAFAAGVLAVVFDLAVTSYPPSLVPQGRLVDANASIQAGGRGAQIAGSGAAGWLVAAVGAPVAVLADAASFVVAGLMQIGLRAPEPPPVPRRSIGSEIVEGIAAVWRDRVLRAMVATTTLGSFGGAIAQPVFVLFAVRRVEVSAPALGMILAAGSIAGLLGSVAAGRIARRLAPGGAMLAGQGAMTAGSVVLVLAPPGTFGTAIVAVAQVLAVGGLAVFSVTQISLRQAITPARLLGRVNATRRVIVFGIIPLGALLGGFLGSQVGLRAALVVAATVNITTAVAVALSPLRTAREGPPRRTPPPNRSAEPGATDRSVISAGDAPAPARRAALGGDPARRGTTPTCRASRA